MIFINQILTIILVVGFIVFIIIIIIVIPIIVIVARIIIIESLITSTGKGTVITIVIPIFIFTITPQFDLRPPPLYGSNYHVKFISVTSLKPHYFGVVSIYYQ